MFYSAELTIPANTAATSPVRATLELTSGVIRRIHCRWRYGVGNLGGVRLLLHEQNQWPRSANTWYPSFAQPIDSVEALHLEVDPSEMIIEAYNTDDRYPHTVWIGVEVSRETLPERLVELLVNLLS